MPTTPNWSTAKASTTSDLGATNYSAQVNQNLGTHNITPIYVGTPIVSPTGTDLAFSWLSAISTT